MELDQFRDVDLVIDKANDNFIQRQFVSQGDYKGRTLTVQVTNNGNVGEVPGLTLNLRWHNEASGLTDLSAFSVVDKSNSIFRIEYPQNMMTPGKVYASIQIIQDGKVTNLKEFELTVQKLAGQPVGIVEKAEFSALVAVLADSNRFRTDIDSLGTTKADKKDLALTDSKVADLDSVKADKTALAQTNANMATSLSNKVDKGGIEQVTLPMLTTEVKKAMTGGSVAVVGDGAVSTSTVVDESITSPKRTVLGEAVSFTFANANKPILDPTAKTITMANGTLLLYREKSVNVSNQVIDYSGVGSVYIKVYYNIKTNTFSAVTGSTIPTDKEYNILVASGYRDGSNWVASFPFDIAGVTKITSQNLKDQTEIQNLNLMGLAKVVNAYDLMLEQDYQTSGTGGSIYLKFAALQARNYSTKNYTWDNIKTQINDTTRFVEPPSKIATDYLKLGDGESLYYNKDTGFVSIKTTTTETYPQELLLAFCWRGRLRAGKFCEQLISEVHKKTTDNSTDIEKLKLGSVTVPDYITNEHSSVNDEISYRDSGTFKFILSTDEHGNEIQYEYIKNMMLYGQADCVVFAGDLMQASEETNYEKARKYLSRIPRLINTIKKPVHVTRGNHDGVSGSQDIKSADFAKVDVDPFRKYKSIDVQQMVDYPDQKIRIIILNSSEDSQARKGFSVAQCDWFDETIKSTPAGYHVITVSHHPINAAMTPDETSAAGNVAGYSDRIVQSIKDFQASGGNHVAHFNGHMHHDWLKKVDGITYVTSNRSAYDNADLLSGDGHSAPSKLLMTKGTTSEYSFDIVSLDLTNKTGKLYRCGCGIDRVRTISW